MGMETLSSSNTEPNFILPDEILHGLELQAETPSATEYSAPNFPAVRILTGPTNYRRPLKNPHEENERTENLRRDYHSYHGLRDHGITVPNFGIAIQPNKERGGQQLYIIAQKAEGVSLEEELSRNPEAAAQFDHITAAQIQATAQKRGSDTVYPDDTLHPGNFVWGKLYGAEDEPSIIFVGFEATGSMFTKGTEQDLESCVEDLHIAAEIVVNTEITLGITMGKSKQAIHTELYNLLAELVVEAENEDQDKDSIARYILAIKTALETNDLTELDEL
jgi:hypothetical protein